MPDATDYAMTPAHTACLKGAALLPAEFRRKLLARFAREHGQAALLEMFAQFVGLANSVVANNREMIELLLITDGKMYPEQAEQINLPTIFGALCGVELATHGEGRGPCATCAYRLGTPANQSPSTTADADYCAGDGEAFWCHEDVGQDGEPQRPCAGWARHRRAEERRLGALEAADG